MINKAPAIRKVLENQEPRPELYDQPEGPITYPARPTNGGPIDKAVPKRGKWIWQPKYNGWRALVHVPTGSMWNRHGERLSIEGEFDVALKQMRNDWKQVIWVDCEALERRHDKGKGSLVIFAVLQSESRDFYKGKANQWCDMLNIFRLPRLKAFARQKGRLQDYKEVIPRKAGAYLCPNVSEFVLEEAWNFMQETNEKEGCEFFEGLVAKKVDSKYHIQLRSPNEKFGYWIKHRFKA